MNKITEPSFIHKDYKKEYDNVNHPKHYVSHPSGVECIDITRHMNFNLGNAIKYIWRSEEKNDKVEDLRKAIFYINDEINKTIIMGEQKPNEKM